MSSFLKFAWEVISQIVYNISAVLTAVVRLFITGWADYFRVFFSYFDELGVVGKVLAVILMLILIAIPVLIIYLLIKRALLHYKLKADHTDNSELYREIGRLNKQVLELVNEKNSILALKVNTMGGTARIPYLGASALVDDTYPVASNVIEGDHTERESSTASTAESSESACRFPKLVAVDARCRNLPPVSPQMLAAIEGMTLASFAQGYRLFAASQLKLYYSEEVVRRYVAGMAASKILILEGISGTGKTSLPYSFGKYMNNPATIVPVQPSFRDKTELLGYFNEFSKKFNETEFLRALYEADWNPRPSTIVLDEMNLARIEYYFAEILSVLEMPSHDEWTISLVPTPWPGDPEKLVDGNLQISDNVWFVGTANNDDSTYTITDKVYDRAMPIEMNERAAAFECAMHPACNITGERLQALFDKACREYPISAEMNQKLDQLNQYLVTRFKLAFGNRILKQMRAFVPAYVACGGREIDAMDYIIARKVLKKFESMNVSFVRDEISGLIHFIDKTFGETEMPDSRAYLLRIQNLY